MIAFGSRRFEVTQQSEGAERCEFRKEGAYVGWSSQGRFQLATQLQHYVLMTPTVLFFFHTSCLVFFHSSLLLQYELLFVVCRDVAFFLMNCFITYLLPDKLNVRRFPFIFFSSVFQLFAPCFTNASIIGFFSSPPSCFFKKTFAWACQCEPSYFVTCENPI